MKPRIRPVAWQPPPAPPLSGHLAPNDLIDQAERIPVGGTGPEDVVVHPDGYLYTGLLDGRIVRVPRDGGPPETVCDTGGRPLGMDLDAEGRLVVCDTERGLLRVTTDGHVEVLCDHYQGEPLRFCNNPHVASDGVIYFSDSSQRFGFADYLADMFEHSRTGRLFAYDPDGTVRLLLDGLAFANGVTMPHGEQCVLVAETSEYRITRLWVSGPEAGQRDVFVENLPGFPDNLSTGPQGTIWVALANPRDRRADALAPHPRLRLLAWYLPEALRPRPVRYGMVLGFANDGRLTHNLQGPAGRYAPTTGVREHDGWLYLGSIEEDAIGRVRVPPPVQ